MWTAIKLDNLLEESEVPLFLKDLIRSVRKTTNISLGQWLKKASTSDLLHIRTSMDNYIVNLKSTLANYTGKKITSVEDLTSRSPDSYPFITYLSPILLIEILCLGEGLDPINNPNQAPIRFDLLKAFISLELLKRKTPAIDIKYDVMSLSGDNMDDVVAVFTKSMVFDTLDKVFGSEQVKKAANSDLKEERESLKETLDEVMDNEGLNIRIKTLFDREQKMTLSLLTQSLVKEGFDSQAQDKKTTSSEKTKKEEKTPDRASPVRDSTNKVPAEKTDVAELVNDIRQMNSSGEAMICPMASQDEIESTGSPWGRFKLFLRDFKAWKSCRAKFIKEEVRVALIPKS